MKKLLLFPLALFLLIACKHENDTQASVITDSEISLADTLRISSPRQVDLLPEAREQVRDWLAYATATDVVENMEGLTGNDIVAASNNLVQIMENLRTTLPDTLQKPAVEARATVLLTKANVLYQVGNTARVNPERVFHLARDIVFEFDNFKLQVNEIFLKAPSDFEKELDKAFEDSLQKDTLAP